MSIRIDLRKKGADLIVEMTDMQSPGHAQGCPNVLSPWDSPTSVHRKRGLWLVDTLEHFVEAEVPSFCVAAGRSGLTAHLLRERFPRSSVTSLHECPGCRAEGERLFASESIRFELADVGCYSLRDESHKVIVCPDCECIATESLVSFLMSRRAGSLVILQARGCQPGRTTSLPAFAAFVQSLTETIVYRGAMSFEDSVLYMVVAR